MSSPFNEHFTFLKQFRETFTTTGAVAPSSRFLAKAMTAPLSRRNGPVRVLEVGPGTGAVTSAIVRQLQEGDRFDLVELNDRFVEVLRRKFDSEQDYRRAAPWSEIHHCPLQTFIATEPYDYIISGLPFNNFPASVVDEILGGLITHLKPTGVLSYFEYMFVRPIRRAISRQDERHRLGELDRIFRRHSQNRHLRRDWVFANLPPAWVQHLEGGNELHRKESGGDGRVEADSTHRPPRQVADARIGSE